tara:strand:+ start:321 stop:602 length:282 start_codon:yes stop_codon:yes gene_type:complete
MYKYDNIDYYTDPIRFELIRETEKARLISVPNGPTSLDALDFWMPKSITKSFTKINKRLYKARFWEEAYWGSFNRAQEQRKRSPRMLSEGGMV